MSDLRLTAATFARGTSYKLTFVALSAVDLLLTRYALGNGYVELNPVLDALQHRPVELLLLKVVAPVAIAWLVPARLLLPSVGLLFAVVGWSVGELLLPP